MKKLLSLIILLGSSIIPVLAQGNPGAEKVLDNAIQRLTNAKGIDTRFSISYSGYSGTGTLLSSGLNFKVSLPDAEVWFNGRDMFTYNPRTKETTVVQPTPEELSQSNPLLYVTSAKNKFSTSFSSVKKSGKYVLELLPKSTKEEIKRITLTLNQSDYRPEKIVVEPKNGSPINIEIKTLSFSDKATPADFEYPAKKYPGVELIDLR